MGEHKLKQTIEAIFSHPIPSNLEWKDVKRLLERLGFEIINTKKNHIKIKGPSSKELILKIHSHTVESKEEIVKLRHFLESEGIDGSSTL